ncbi:5'/3'-nucleotidase SurE [Oscillatoriales cyanobacterium USR001]|nr:5'/3'-nucleotidase SurE [Oscillatoriales cyanobacterium USR001]
MTFILTNDDGIDGPGIKALLRAVNEKAIIVAPQGQLSGCGHQVTTHVPIHVDRRSEFEYAIDGTPVDCVRIALTHIFPKAKFVLSGINPGGNLGADVYISGTVAAVREAAMLGVPAIAFSHWIKKPLTIDWNIATNWTSRVLAELLNLPSKPGTYWNVNFPHLEPGTPDPEIVFCPLSTQPLPVKYRIEGDYFHYVGEYGKRDRAPGTDVDVCFSGNIAVTEIRL